jgi:hypothetical protein
MERKMKKTKQLFLALILLAVFVQGSTLYADSSGKMMEMTLSVRNGTGDDPMIVVWVETDTGDFVKTLHMFSEKKAYYKDMLGWLFKSRKTEKLADVDAVSGATIRWNRSATISVPAQIDGHDLLDGTYVLRIESRKDKGNHYRGFKIPIPAGYSGGVHEDPGYVESVKISIQDNAQ